MNLLMIPSEEVKRHNKLSANTIKRLNAGLDLWWSGGFDKIVLTGGIYNSSDVQSRPASVLMRIYLMANGVDKNKILVERKSLDTFENVKNVLEKLEYLDIDQLNITVVTQWQHAIRFWICFRSYGIKVALFPLKYSVSLFTSLKEYFFILYHVYDKKGRKFLARLNRKFRTQ